jgi:hypothetical protein
MTDAPFYHNKLAGGEDDPFKRAAEGVNQMTYVRSPTAAFIMDALRTARNVVGAPWRAVRSGGRGYTTFEPPDQDYLDHVEPVFNEVNRLHPQYRPGSRVSSMLEIRQPE